MLCNLDRIPESYLQIKHQICLNFSPNANFIYYFYLFFGYFIRSFNSSDNVISTTETPAHLSEFTEQTQQRIEPTHRQESEKYAAEQPILYVTPATEIKDDGSNTEINVAHTKAATSTLTNLNPLFTVDNEQQQSDAYDMPAASTLVDQSPALQEYASTGRAVDYNRPTYNFNQLITPLIKSPPLPAPTVRGKPVTSNIGKIVYPQAFHQRRPPNQSEINKLSGKGKCFVWIYRSKNSNSIDRGWSLCMIMRRAIVPV